MAATYFWPNQSHASLGPSCAVADVRDGGDDWSSSQVSHGLREPGRLFGLAAETARRVRRGVGIYGTNGADNAAADALLLSKPWAAGPCPVDASGRTWLGSEGAAAVSRSSRGARCVGRIAAWETRMWIPANRPGARPLLAAAAAGIRRKTAGTRRRSPRTATAVPGRERAGGRPLAEGHAAGPVELARPGKVANVSLSRFIDEIAAARRRRSRIQAQPPQDPRAIEALEPRRDAFGWQPRPSPNPRASGAPCSSGAARLHHYKQPRTTRDS